TFSQLDGSVRLRRTTMLGISRNWGSKPRLPHVMTTPLSQRSPGRSPWIRAGSGATSTLNGRTRVRRVFEDHWPTVTPSEVEDPADSQLAWELTELGSETAAAARNDQEM